MASSLHLHAGALTIATMKTRPKKKGAARGIKYKRAASLGRSPLTGAPVFKPVAKGASISLDDVRRVLRALKPLALDWTSAAESPLRSRDARPARPWYASLSDPRERAGHTTS